MYLTTYRIFFFSVKLLGSPVRFRKESGNRRVFVKMSQMCHAGLNAASASRNDMQGKYCHAAVCKSHKTGICQTYMQIRLEGLHGVTYSSLFRCKYVYINVFAREDLQFDLVRSAHKHVFPYSDLHTLFNGHNFWSDHTFTRQLP